MDPKEPSGTDILQKHKNKLKGLQYDNNNNNKNK